MRLALAVRGIRPLVDEYAEALSEEGEPGDVFRYRERTREIDAVLAELGLDPSGASVAAPRRPEPQPAVAVPPPDQLPCFLPGDLVRFSAKAIEWFCLPAHPGGRRRRHAGLRGRFARYSKDLKMAHVWWDDYAQVDILHRMFLERCDDEGEAPALPQAAPSAPPGKPQPLTRERWLEHQRGRTPAPRDGKRKAIANGVPLPMGRAIAAAVRAALGMPTVEARDQLAPEAAIEAPA